MAWKNLREEALDLGESATGCGGFRSIRFAGGKVHPHC